MKNKIDELVEKIDDSSKLIEEQETDTNELVEKLIDEEYPEIPEV